MIDGAGPNITEKMTGDIACSKPPTSKTAGQPARITPKKPT
jgi:hypothetical protein